MQIKPFTFTFYSVLAITLLTAPAFGHEGHWKAPSDTVNMNNPVTADFDSISRGEAVYKSLCSGCHGVDGRGRGTATLWIRGEPTALDMHTESDGEIFWKIRNGRNSMPGYARVIIRKHIWDVVNYMEHGLKSPSP